MRVPVLSTILTGSISCCRRADNNEKICVRSVRKNGGSALPERTYRKAAYIKEKQMKNGIIMRIAALIAAAVLLCTGLSSCGKTDYAVFRFAVETQAVTFDPQIAEDGTAKIIVRNTFEGLVRPDINGNISPGAAASWEITDGGMTYTFRLRSGVKWHLTDNAAEQLKGKLPENFAPEVTANDFVFALRRAVDPATGAPDAELLLPVQNAAEILAGTKKPEELGVYAPDEKTLVIKLATPSESFLETLCEPLCMPCNEVFFNACAGRYGLLIAYSLSNGPFYLSYFDETTYRIRKSDDYSGEHASKADTIWFYYQSDPDTVVQKLKNGDYSGAYLTETQLEAMSPGKKFGVIKVADTNRVFFLNCKNEKLAVKELRDAFMYATDTSSAAKESGAEEAFFAVPDVACVENAEAPSKPFDVSLVSGALDKATELLETDSVTVTVLYEKKDAEVLKRLLQQWQKNFGIRLEIKLEEVSSQTLLSRVEGGDWEIAFYPLRVSSSDPTELFNEFRFAETGSLTGLNDPEYDKKAASFAASSGEERAKLFLQLNQTLISDGAVLPVWKETSCFVCAEGVTGVYVGAGADRRYFENVSKEK